MERNKDLFDDDEDILESLSDDLLISEPISEDLSWGDESEAADEDSQPSKPVPTIEDSVLKQEAERQEMGDYEGTILERDRALQQMEEAQQFLEDELEDANTEIDRLRRELDKLVVEAEEAEFQRKEAEGARKQVESSLYEMREGVESSRVTDLRDERMHRSRRSLGINQVTLWPLLKGLGVGLVLGAILVIGILEISLLIDNKDELFKLVFGN